MLSSSSGCPAPFPRLWLGQRSPRTNTPSRWAHSSHALSLLEVPNSLALSFASRNASDVTAGNPSPAAALNTPSRSSRPFLGFAEFLIGFSCWLSEQWKDLINSKHRPAKPPGFSHTSSFCTLNLDTRCHWDSVFQSQGRERCERKLTDPAPRYTLPYGSILPCTELAETNNASSWAGGD